MSIVWAICGAAKGVGKTTLAQSLAQILPCNTYAKGGHGKPKPDKPSRFFNTTEDLLDFVERSRASCDHIIVESNAAECLDKADIVIFIDAGPEETNVRSDADQLRSRADIIIAPDSRPFDQTKKLQKVVAPHSLLPEISEVLSRQQLHPHTVKPEVHLKIWFEHEGKPILGRGLAQLLRNVHEQGTLRAAANISGISYRHAWHLIRTAEGNLGRKLIHRRAGGKTGGTSVLTDTGRRLIEIFTQLDRDIQDYAQRRLGRLEDPH